MFASLEVTDGCKKFDSNSIFQYETQTNETDNEGPQFRSAAVREAWEEKQRNSYKSTSPVTLATSDV